MSDVSFAEDPSWYLDHVLYHAQPGGGRVVVGAAAAWQDWWRIAARDLPSGISDLARAQGFAVRTSQLDAIPRGVRRRLVRAGAWAAPQRGVVTVLDPRDPADEWQTRRRRHALDAAAAALMNPGHVVAGASAVILHGLPTPDVPPTPLVQVDAGRSTRRRGGGEATLPVDDLDTWWGVPVVSVERAIADVARHDRAGGLMAVDAALHEGLTTSSRVSACVQLMQRWPGVGRAREVLSLADAASESPLESLVRLRLHDDGFPPPCTQLEIAVPGRRYPYRVDFSWPERRVILEADGLGKYDTAALRRERRREAELRAVGWRIERVLWSDVLDAWPRTARLLRGALAV